MRDRKRQKERGGNPERRHRSAQNQRGRRFTFVWLPVIILTMLSLYALAFDPSHPVGQPVTGTTRDSERARFGDSDGTAYMVVLDGGKAVEIDGSLMGPLKAGRRVLVQENVTFIFKRKYYSFVRYLE